MTLGGSGEQCPGDQKRGHLDRVPWRMEIGVAVSLAWIHTVIRGTVTIFRPSTLLETVCVQAHLVNRQIADPTHGEEPAPDPGEAQLSDCSLEAVRTVPLNPSCSL